MGEMKEYKRVCAWCSKSMGTIMAEDNGLDIHTTHGMCDKCFADFNRKAKTTEKATPPAPREPTAAELEKALQLCLTCLDNIKPSIDYVGVLSYIDATTKAARAVITR